MVSSTPMGQAFTQAPHNVHLLSSIWIIVSSAFIVSNGMRNSKSRCVFGFVDTLAFALL
jgi:hypothetical protein